MKFYVKIEAKKNGILIRSNAELDAKDCFDAIGQLMNKLEVKVEQTISIEVRPPFEGL